MNYIPTLLAVGGGFWMPERASTFAQTTDRIFGFVLWLDVLFFLLVMGATTYFAVKYKRRGADDRTSPIRGNHRLEILWAGIPAILLVVIFAWNFDAYMRQKIAPANAIEIGVVGQKWSWGITYPNGGTDSNRLVVPVGEPVRLTMTSTDVLHSFYVPAFRVKQDVLPNRYTTLWFEATEVGNYHIFCAEYCGDNHSYMIGTVEVVSRERYEAYLAELGGCGEDEDLADCGARVFVRAGCTACHSDDGSPRVWPTWLGLWESERQFTDGTTGTADADYLREAIMDPNASIVTGFMANQMPTYAGRLEEEQLQALIAFIQSLAN